MHFSFFSRFFVWRFFVFRGFDTSRIGFWTKGIIMAAIMTPAASLTLSAPAGAVDIQSVTSKGGVTAWLVEDSSLPVVSLSFFSPIGSAGEASNVSGLTSMTAFLLDEGAGSYDATAFQERLEDEAANISFHVSRDNFSGDMRCLSDNCDRVAALLALALNRPRFDPPAIERVRAQMISVIDRNEQNPSSVARRTWFERAFSGQSYALNPIGRRDSLSRIKRSDLLARHKDIISGHFDIGVVGDISADRLADLLDRIFVAPAALQSRAAPPQKSTPPSKSTKPPKSTKPLESIKQRGVFRVERDISQSSVVFGLEGVGRKDRDYYALKIINYVLGGGSFNARLMQEIREKRGLAYSVHSWLDEMVRAPLLMGALATENTRLDQALDILRAQIGAIGTDSITQAELAAAKTYFIHSQPVRMGSTRNLARMLAAIRYYDLGMDYLDRRRAIIEAVTGDDVRRVAKKILDPKRLFIVVVGAEKTKDKMGNKEPDGIKTDGAENKG